MNFYGWLNAGNKFLWCGILLAGLGLSGCSTSETPDPTAPLNGKVTFKGTPVSEGMVNLFDSKRGNAAAAKLGADGTYSMPAVVLGNYDVSITPLQVEPSTDATKPAPPPANPENIPEKYRDSKTSGLKAVVKAGNNTADFELIP